MINYLKQHTHIDAVEIRSDLMDESPELEQMRTSFSGKMIFTHRPKSEDEFEHVKTLYKMALAADFDYVDIDVLLIGEFSEVVEQAGSRLVISVHNYDNCTIHDEVLKTFENYPDAVIKIAATPHDTYESFLFVKHLCERFPRVVLVNMFIHGEWLRTSFSKFNGLWNYFCLPDQSTAPGQLSLADWNNEFDVPVDKDTLLYGITGNPIDHSLSPKVHNFFFRTRNINAIYNRFPAVNLELFFEHAPSDMAGLSVTTPYKRRIIPYVKELSTLAENAGVVNTLKKLPSGDWFGDNTDGPGIRMLLEEHYPEWKECRNIIILGAGGVARACLATFGDVHQKIVICNRSVAKAYHLAEKFGCEYRPLGEVDNVEDCLVIQATSVDMTNTDENPFWKLKGNSNTIVVESIYKPRETKLMQVMSPQTNKLIYGEDVFSAQAVLQQQIWHQKSMEVGEVKDVINGKI
jgi:shikimate dehydrogenase